MKKVEFVEAVAAKTGFTKADATRAADAVWDVVKEALVNGDKVAIAGFGTFSVGERAAREGRNPQTGETIHIAASKGVNFKAGTELKDKINN